MFEHDARRDGFILEKRLDRHDTIWDMMETTLSLTGGTFCAACQAFFVYSGVSAVCRTPKGERQNEDQI